jgi:hypothetical protein
MVYLPSHVYIIDAKFKCGAAITTNSSSTNNAVLGTVCSNNTIYLFGVNVDICIATDIQSTSNIDATH